MKFKVKPTRSITRLEANQNQWGAEDGVSKKK